MSMRGGGGGGRGGMGSGGGGPSFVSQNGSGPAREQEEAEAKPKNIVEWWAQFRRNARTTMAGTPRAFSLVWNAHKGFTVALAVFSIIAGIIPSLTALVSKLLIDHVVAAVGGGTEAENIQPVIWLALAQLGLYIISSLLQTLRNIVQQLIQELTANRVQVMIMQHANRLDLAFFENPKFYDSLRQAQTEANYRPLTMVQGLFGLISSLITFLSMIALIASLGWVVALAALLSPIPSFIASSRYGWQGYMMARRQSMDRRRMAYFLDLVTKDTYNKEIKLFGLGNHFIDRWREIAARFFAENRTLVTKRYLAGFAWGSLTTVVTSGAFIYVALRAVAGALTIGDLTLYTQAINSVQNSFQSILNGISGLYENSLYLNNLFEFLDYEPKIQNRPDAIKIKPPLKQGIEFRNVSFTYPGKRDPALRDVSFYIQPDETVALVGQNGAGKTTIVKLLTRLYDPDDGAIFIDGHDIRDYDLASLHAIIGVMFQDYATYFFSARDNIGVGRLEDMENSELVQLAAAKSGADTVIGKLPQGYDTTLGRWFDEGYQLSGGEWQKVALARAFMRDAEILILDEPTASLDARAEYDIFARMKQLTEGKMAIFISHRFSTVRLADRIFVLENGIISENGTHEELLAANKTYAELFNLQAAAYR